MAAYQVVAGSWGAMVRFPSAESTGEFGPWMTCEGPEVGLALGLTVVDDGGATDGSALEEALLISGGSEGGPSSVDDERAADCDALEESLVKSERETLRRPEGTTTGGDCDALEESLRKSTTGCDVLEEVMCGLTLGPEVVGDGGTTDCDALEEALEEASGKSGGCPKSVDDCGATGCDVLDESLRKSEGEALRKPEGTTTGGDCDAFEESLRKSTAGCDAIEDVLCGLALGPKAV